MSPTGTVTRTLFGRHVATAYAVIVALYLVRHVRFPPVQLPAYLFIVVYDLVEVSLPVITPYHPIGFPLFLYLLAVVVGAVTRWARAESGEPPDWSRVAGGVSLVVAALSLLFAVVVRGPLVSATDNPTPLAITGATGVVLAVVGWWLLRGRSA